MEPARLRIYLTGAVCMEAGGRSVGESQFGGRQGRLVFAHLVCERMRPVTRDELAEVVWLDTLPPAWEVALSALVSKLRNLLRSTGLPPQAASISGYFRRYQMHLPADTWVDVEAAAQAIDEAEGALRAGALQRAWGPANVAVTIARRPFLSGGEGVWVEFQRTKLEQLLVRGLDCLSEISLRNHEGSLAVQYASEVVGLEPFRETGYQRLMRAHATQGNRAEALRAYERCRKLLAEELGTDPSPETEALYLHLLRLPSPAS